MKRKETHTFDENKQIHGPRVFIWKRIFISFFFASCIDVGAVPCEIIHIILLQIDGHFQRHGLLFGQIRIKDE